MQCVVFVGTGSWAHSLHLMHNRYESILCVRALECGGLCLCVGMNTGQWAFCYTHNTIGRGRNTKKYTLMRFIWVAVETAFVCRQTGCGTGLFSAKYTGTVTFSGTKRAGSFGGSLAAAGLEHRRFPRRARKTLRANGARERGSFLVT